jgi:hypothetical protein
MECYSSLLQSQVPATCPSPDPARSSPYIYISLPKDPSSYYRPNCNWVSQVVSFPQISPSKRCINLSFPIHATCPAHLLLDFITRTILGDQYRSLGSALWSFLHFPVTPSFLGPNIFFNTLISNTPGYIPPTLRATNFHNHTKQQAKLYFCIS